MVTEPIRAMMRIATFLVEHADMGGDPNKIAEADGALLTATDLNTLITYASDLSMALVAVTAGHHTVHSTLQADCSTCQAVHVLARGAAMEGADA